MYMAYLFYQLLDAEKGGNLSKMLWWYCLVSGLILLVKILESLGLVVSDVKETKHEHNPPPLAQSKAGWRISGNVREILERIIQNQLI